MGHWESNEGGWIGNDVELLSYILGLHCDWTKFDGTFEARPGGIRNSSSGPLYFHFSLMPT